MMTVGMSATSPITATGCIRVPVASDCWADMAQSRRNAGAHFNCGIAKAGSAAGKIRLYTNTMVATISGSISPPIIPVRIASSSRPR